MIRPPDRKQLNGGAEPFNPAPPGRADGDDRRGHPRQAVAWHGRIMISNAPSVHCVVLNVSERGARLRLRLSIDLPAAFELAIDRFGELSVELLEQEQAIVRVAFLDEPEKVKKFFRHTLPVFRKPSATA